MNNELKKADDKVLGIMPVIGLGTWEMIGPACTESVINALELGYRHLDTAQIYGNEKEVGKGIQRSGIDRKDIFITTKIATTNLTSVRIKRTASESLEKLGTGYVDLLLIHWPTASMNLTECLESMFQLKEQGLVKYVGVSNFEPDLFRKALEAGNILTNQVKFTPYHEEFENLEVARENDKIITAYSPLARGGITNDKTLATIGQKYGKTASQVTLRWLIQLGNISVIPKAHSNHHQVENINIFDFSLTDDDMEMMKQLGRKVMWH